MNANGGRGRSRVRARARGGSGGVGSIRGRGRGRSARSLDLMEAGSSTTTPSPASSLLPQPTNSLAEQIKKVRIVRVADQKNLKRLTMEQKATLAVMREKKQVARYLMPDAPPSKKNKRKTSPSRQPCPLLPGVPATPPPRKVQAWEKQSLVASISGPSGSHIERSTPSPEFLDESIFDDNDFLGVENDPGSDVDEPDQIDNAGTVGQSSSLSRTEEDLPSDLALLLDQMGNRDDFVMKEAASSNPDMLHFDWSNDPDTFVGQQETFSGESGPTFPVDGLTPLDVFQRIWDANIIDVMVRESNRYGRQLYATANKLWSDIGSADVWVFLALLMLQSILILPVEREYWYPCMALLKVGNFHNIMPMQKFLRIKKCLHFVDNNILGTDTGEKRKLQKIWPIIEHLNRQFSSLYLPEQYIAIDESLLLWKGRLSFVQLIATKAARVGIKSYELCESRTGYLWNMLIYTGKCDKAQPAYETTASHDEPERATSKIVHNLIRPLLNKGHTLVMDNFYNSPLLSRTLKSKKTDTMGTLRLKREFVPEALKTITKANTRQGEVIYSHTNDLTISVWYDANIVAMISTYHKSVVGGKEKYGTYKYKPQVVLDYNMTMGGVDKKDQMLQAFPVERVRNLVWYKKLFRRLLNVSIYNAFVIYNHNKNGNQRQFRVALAKEILVKIQGQIPDPRREMRLTTHFPAKAETNRSRCKMCSIKKVQTRTAYKCEGCNVSLCIVGCFKEYHSME